MFALLRVPLPGSSTPDRGAGEHGVGSPIAKETLPTTLAGQVEAAAMDEPPSCNGVGGGAHAGSQEALRKNALGMTSLFWSISPGDVSPSSPGASSRRRPRLQGQRRSCTHAPSPRAAARSAEAAAGHSAGEEPRRRGIGRACCRPAEGAEATGKCTGDPKLRMPLQPHKGHPPRDRAGLLSGVTLKVPSGAHVLGEAADRSGLNSIKLADGSQSACAASLRSSIAGAPSKACC